MITGVTLFMVTLVDPIRILISFLFSFAFLNLKKTLSKVLFVIFATVTLGVGFAAYNNSKAFMYDRTQFGAFEEGYLPPFKELDGTKYSAYTSDFTGSGNPRETAYLKNLVDQRIKYCESLMGTIGCDETTFKATKIAISLLVSLCHVLFFMWLYNYWVKGRGKNSSSESQL